MEIQHPAAKLLVETAKATDAEVGDGTTSAVVLAGLLLQKAEKLLDQNIHPTIIIEGYKKAQTKALEFLRQMGVKVDVTDLNSPSTRSTLRKILHTTMASKFMATGASFEKLMDLLIDAVVKVAEPLPGGGYNVSLDNIKIDKKKGGSIEDSMLVHGLVLDKEVVHGGMPRRVEKAKIAVMDAALEVEKPEISAKISITSPEQIKSFLDEEAKYLQEMVNKLASIGANVVICQKGIDDVAQHFLAKKGILAVRRAKKSDLEKLARATGGRIVSNIDELTEQDLGYAELVEERKVGEDKMVFVEGAKNPKAVSILVRGGLERIVDEAERAIKDALGTTADVIREGKVVAGGGAIELEIAKRLRKLAPQVGGKEQLAIEAFASAVEGIPITLIENAGLDPVDVLVRLRSLHESEQNLWYGINLLSGQPEDMMKLGVIEPAVVKANAIKAATEAATLILRIDDIVVASKKSEAKGKEGEKKEKEGEKKEED